MDKRIKKCLVHEESKICLISIPKVGSTFFRQKYRMKYVNYDCNIHSSYTKIVVFRNPTERMWSIYYQLLKYPNYNFTSIQELFEKMDIDGYFDIHLYPQMEFLNSKSLKLSDLEHIFYNILDADNYLEKHIHKKYIFSKNKNNKNIKNVDDISYFLNKYYNQDLFILKNTHSYS